MLYTIPHYYNRFQCMAGSCPDTCCAGWEIAIDPKSLKKYRKMHGPLGNRLHNSIRWERGVFRQYGRRCAFLNEEGLCDLQAEGGEGMLCQTCRLYPRHVEEFEGVREISLSLSCIRAAQTILGCREPVRFLRRERESPEETFEDFDYFLYTKLTDSRDLALAILQNRTMDINVRMLMALSLAHDVQRRIQAGRLFEVDALLTRYGLRTRPAICRRRKGTGCPVFHGGIKSRLGEGTGEAVPGALRRRASGLSKAPGRIPAVDGRPSRIGLVGMGGAADGLFPVYLLLRGRV